MRRQSVSSATSEDDEEFIEDDDDNQHHEQNSSSNPSGANGKTRTKKKKTLGRVKIEMAYINNKIRRYTTFSKRKTGIMKKAYELATLTGTEVMLLVASETGESPSSDSRIIESEITALPRSCLYLCHCKTATDDNQ